ncbi:MAG: hypothetical protein JWR19_1108 [Pedosphaera sp.]|nr:hypothetical protein [Pedosphaera sp.]
MKGSFTTKGTKGAKVGEMGSTTTRTIGAGRRGTMGPEGVGRSRKVRYGNGRLFFYGTRLVKVKFLPRPSGWWWILGMVSGGVARGSTSGYFLATRRVACVSWRTANAGIDDPPSPRLRRTGEDEDDDEDDRDWEVVQMLGKVERAAGIEPAWLVWKTRTLPLSYARVGMHINSRACVVNSPACMV